MPDIVLLSKVRERKSLEAHENLVAGLKKLLKAAKRGELRGLCYATVSTNDVLTFGILHTPDCGLHELVGVSQILNFRLTQAVAEEGS